jgi:hypothetical protein
VSPGVVDGVVAHFALDSGWTSKVREFGEKAVDRCAVADGLDSGDQRAGCLSRFRQRCDPVQ